MTWPSVDINQINNHSGEVSGVEQIMLFVGLAGAPLGDSHPLLAVSAESDLDDVLAKASPDLFEQVRAAQLNGGQNWGAYVLLAEQLVEEDPDNPEQQKITAPDWLSNIELALSKVGVEGVMLCDDVNDISAGRTRINDLQALRASVISSLGRRVWFITTVASPTALETPLDWAGYREFLNDLQDGIKADAVQLVPSLWGNEAGVLAGRLCNRAVTVADTPARVATGELLGLGIGSSDLPVDKDGVELSLAWLKAFEAIRYSVPMWWADYEGMYWADGRTLEAEGGDYEAIEYLRVMDKVARRVRLQAIAKIGNRTLNTTPVSIETHKTFFGKTLREMSHTTQLGGVTFPGEVEPPKEGDVTITWLTKTHVVIGIVATPYGCPKQITVNIGLDRELEE
ncbi:DUF2586 domain-containing protein [Enterobacter roggenkampii]|uniref:DUF2586 domain-containing protein n=1 Tax=Enterobacter roggenkampii TaxID=1812935 RepID=UPI0021C5AE0C|nr:DUF2586 domain-containing protein [Enterobacter roggenkampii]MCU2348189.1 DUF2586 domain-containing protein [Enterobacter roggenkampii]